MKSDLLKQIIPKDTKKINILLISDYEKSVSFITIKKLYYYLKTTNSTIVTFFHNTFDKENINNLKNILNKNFDIIIISLTKDNLLNLRIYDFYEKAFNNKSMIFIFGAKSAWKDVKNKYNVRCYERRGVSKTSQQFIRDISLFIARKKKGLT